MSLVRADQLAVLNGLARSRTQAQELIKNGAISVAGADHGVGLKASTRLPPETVLRRATDAQDDFVSRAGHKLAHALREFGIDPAGKHAADLGQSTGGFTQCLLRRGAAAVVGVEVGHGQLAAELRDNTAVVTLERTHVRDISREFIASELAKKNPSGKRSKLALAIVNDGFDCVVVDLSFISQRLVMAQIAALLASSGDLVSLVKPQFELGPGRVNKHGIVRDREARDGLRNAFETALGQHRLALVGWIPSPLLGGDGNHEFLMHARRA